MTVDPIRVFSTSGRLFYFPPEYNLDLDSDLDLSSSSIPTYYALTVPSQPSHRIRRPQIICIRPVSSANDESREQVKAPRRNSLALKLADSRETAKKFIRFFILGPKPKSATSRKQSTTSTLSPSPILSADQPVAVDADGGMHRRGHPTSSGPPSSVLPPTIPSSLGAIPRMIGGSSAESLEERIGSCLFEDRETLVADGGGDAASDELPTATANGISIFVTLTEPVLWLQGMKGEPNCKTSMLRGSLLIRCTKPVKIKAITLTFRGRSRTEWPEGMPPQKVDFYEEDSTHRHTWPFFNAQFPTAEEGHCADYCQLLTPTNKPDSSLTIPRTGRFTFGNFDSSRASSQGRHGLTSNQQKRLSLQLNNSLSFTRGDMTGSKPTVSQKGYRTFEPGDYIYNFEHPLEGWLPETIDLPLGNVRYELEAIVERSGAFRPNLLGHKEVKLIRAPMENSTETSEPISISRTWEDQLHYEIVISGKTFALGSRIPIAIKLVPLAKVRCHRIRVYVHENVQYLSRDRRVQRMEPMKKVELFEKRADKVHSSLVPGSEVRVLSRGGVQLENREKAREGNEAIWREESLMGDLLNEHNLGPTEMEFHVQLPTCKQVRAAPLCLQLHPDTSFKLIKVHHWIRIVMRLSRPDPNDSGKQRHFEISIDSPIGLMECFARQAYLTLPAYYDAPAYNTVAPLNNNECGCADALPRRRPSTLPCDALGVARPLHVTSNDHSALRSDSHSLATPPEVHTDAASSNGAERPIHLLRQPSSNPPDFDADQAPPPLATPPPQYDSIAGGDGLVDYFLRLADETATADGNDDEGGRGRMDMPLAPGGRVNRSMDATRTWLPVGAAPDLSSSQEGSRTDGTDRNSRTAVLGQLPEI